MFSLNRPCRFFSYLRFYMDTFHMRVCPISVPSPSTKAPSVRPSLLWRLCWSRRSSSNEGLPKRPTPRGRTTKRKGGRGKNGDDATGGGRSQKREKERDKHIWGGKMDFMEIQSQGGKCKEETIVRVAAKNSPVFEVHKILSASPRKKPFLRLSSLSVLNFHSSFACYGILFPPLSPLLSKPFPSIHTHSMSSFL